MRLTQVLISAVLLMSSSLAMAETNIAVLNIPGVVLSSNMASDFRAQMERDLKPRQDELLARQEELKKLQEEGKRDADFLSDEQKRELATQFGMKMREFQQMGDELGKEQSRREQEFIESVRPKLDTVVNEIVKKRGIDLLLDRRSVLFANNEASLDISKEVLDALNAAK